MSERWDKLTRAQKIAFCFGWPIWVPMALCYGFLCAIIYSTEAAFKLFDW